MVSRVESSASGPARRVPAALPNSHVTTNTNLSPLKTARATQLVRRAGEWKWLHAAAAAEPLQGCDQRLPRRARSVRPRLLKTLIILASFCQNGFVTTRSA